MSTRPSTLPSTPTSLPLATRADYLVGSVIDSSTSLLAAQTHDIVRFAMGSPAPDSIPAQALSQLAPEAMGAAAPDAFDYAATQGDPALVDALVSQLDGTSDATTADRVTITSGGMQGLDLTCKLFVDPGDLVAVESPTYTNGSATALSYQAELLEVPVDADGMNVDALVALSDHAGRHPKLIYTVPTFQNPSGVTMSTPRRRRLLELAREWGSVVLDDDPYGALAFDGERPTTLHELADGDPLVVSVRTFSKTIAPGLRVGWMDTDPALQPLLIHAKQAMDTCTNLPLQRLVAAFLRHGLLDEHLATQRARYAQRKAAMQGALAEHFTGLAHWTDPAGGFFLWLTFEEPVDTQRLFEVALAEGVAFIPGNAFSPAGAFPHALRLCFASSSPERIAQGVTRLRRAVDVMAGRSAATVRS